MKASRLFNRAFGLAIGLAVALAGCGKSPRKTVPLATFGQASCDYVAGNKQRNLGNFDVQLILKNPGVYALYITPISLAVVGDLVTISIFGEGGIYKELIPQLQPKAGKTIHQR